MPNAELLPFVDHYRFRVGQTPLSGSSPLIFPARTSQFIEFYLGDRIQVKQDGKMETVPKAVLVGTQAVKRLELFIGTVSRTFTIMFRPTGFYRLFGVPLTELAGKGVPSEDVLGASMIELYERFADCQQVADIIQIANCFLQRYASKTSRTLSDRYVPIEQSLSSAMTGPRPFSVDHLVSASMVSQRQFERMFVQATGVGPKRYLRVMRLNEALAIKRRSPDLSWGAVALDCGYFDQMHLVHEFRALGGETPSALLASTSASREE